MNTPLFIPTHISTPPNPTPSHFVSYVDSWSYSFTLSEQCKLLKVGRRIISECQFCVTSTVQMNQFLFSIHLLDQLTPRARYALEPCIKLLSKSICTFREISVALYTVKMADNSIDCTIPINHFTWHLTRVIEQPLQRFKHKTATDPSLILYVSTADQKCRHRNSMRTNGPTLWNRQ